MLVNAALVVILVSFFGETGSKMNGSQRHESSQVESVGPNPGSPSLCVLSVGKPVGTVPILELASRQLAPQCGILGKLVGTVPILAGITPAGATVWRLILERVED